MCHVNEMESSDLELRPIRAEDDAQLAQLIRSVMEEVGVCGEGTSAADVEIDAMFAAYSLPRHSFFVWTREKAILGGGGIGPLAGSDDKTCELRKMYLHPSIRGHGKGHQLLATCLDAAREHGFERCYLETMSQMEAARKLYLRFGFIETETPLGDTGHQCHRWMIRNL